MVVKLGEGRKNIRNELFRMIKDAYEKKSSYEVLFDKRDSHQCVIRKNEIDNDVNKTQLMLEMEVVGLTPDYFVSFFQNITE